MRDNKGQVRRVTGVSWRVHEWIALFRLLYRYMRPLANRHGSRREWK